MGPLKKDLTCVGGSELGSYEDVMNVLRILAVGGSICRVLRGSEALGRSRFRHAGTPGGSATDRPHVRAGRGGGCGAGII